MNSNRPPGKDLAQQSTSAFSYLLLFLVVALLLRIAIFRFSPSIYWSDEIFQTQEPAHRLAYGPGVITWEYRLGLRSWFLPLVIAGIMKCTSWMASGSTGYVYGTALFFSLSSLLIVWFAYSWCRRYFGLQYALLAAFTTTIWFELINFAPRALNEMLAGNLFLPAIYLGFLKPDSKPESKWRLILIGLLLGLTVCLRIQFGPAVLLAGLWIMSRDWKTRFLPISSAIAFVVLIFGILDAVFWSIPFYSYLAYYRENIIHHRAAEYGVLPWYYFFSSLFVHTGPLALFALAGLRRSPILGWISLAILLPHSLIAHKEFRYIYPVLPLLLTLASIGILDSLQFLEKKTSWRTSPQLRCLIAAAIVLSSSLVLASLFPKWNKSRGGLRTFSTLSLDSQACGLAVFKIHWWETGGYTYLHRPIPILLFSDGNDLTSVAQAFNRIVAPESVGEPLRGYSVSNCSDGICIYQRAGTCQVAGSQFEVNEYLKERGE